ncbi:MAG: poly-beta-1,6 N-acetyl-D-glucosamine export porin PgaA [Gammaproteobacteria bacterium]|nr:poly-beta-1,6 N-acetyl-D-glucosamine export porin PgaA [Gammaproteobacteria bacterium]MBU1777376.1 poly-beta-1,6 N-acetyl-D-glucosamine export porin PgaA [Gammaproteobacteria bacterium]
MLKRTLLFAILFAMPSLQLVDNGNASPPPRKKRIDPELPPVTQRKKRAEPDIQYANALKEYHDQKPDRAISLLRDLHQRDPEDERYLYDYLAIASWSGQHDLAAGLSSEVDRKKAPAYVLEAIASSHRQLGQYDTALATYAAEIRRFPDRIDPRLGRVEVLIDMQRLKEAESELSPLLKSHPNQQNVRMTSVRLHDGQNQPLQMLADAQQILRSNPESAFALRMRFFALSKLGAVHLATQLTPADIITPAERAAAKRDQLAFELRWARSDASRPESPNRWQTTDAAIAQMRQVCPADKLDESDFQDIQGWCKDLVVALSDRGEAKQAVALYENMLDQQWPIPAYVRMYAAASYLDDRQPEKARALYAATLPQDPGNLNGRIGNIYALLESGDTDAACLEADRLAAETKEWINPEYPALRQPNPAYIRAQVASAMVRSYSDRLQEGQNRLELLARRAPRNADIRRSLSATYGYRGWHHRAEDDLVWLSKADAADVDTRLRLFENRKNLGDFRGAEQALASAARILPGDPSVKKSEREWATHNLHQLVVDLRYGRGSAGNAGTSPGGNRESAIDARLYSAPHDYDWRYFAHSQIASTAYPGVTVTRPAVGGGAEYRVRDLTMSGELINIGRNGAGVNFDGDYRIDDQWSISGKLESKSLSAPIRAYPDGVTANNIQLSAKYRWHESRSLGVVSNRMKFSDGNRRSALDVSWVERIISGPAYKLDTNLEYYTSRNFAGSASVNYFNPASDRYLGLALRNEWLQYRKAGRSLRHSLVIGLGNYSQQDYASGKVISLQYEQTFRLDDRLEFRYGIGHTTHPYDGASFSENHLGMTMDWMF